MELTDKQVAVIFKAMSDENRIRIMKLLRSGEKCACKLLEELNISQPTLSHHMKILCDAGLVTGRREGKWTHYSICCEGTDRVIGLLRDLCAVQAPSLVQLLPHGNHDPDDLQDQGKGEAVMKKVAFICVHNSCRSQMAEALGKKLASDVFESYSAGTETKPRINPDAVRLMKQVHGIDMEATQHSKLLSDIPEVDVVITMGCNGQCPFLPCSHREDWGLEDPSGKSDEAFLETIRLIEEKVLELKAKLA